MILLMNSLTLYHYWNAWLRLYCDARRRSLYSVRQTIIWINRRSIPFKTTSIISIFTFENIFTWISLSIINHFLLYLTNSISIRVLRVRYNWITNTWIIFIWLYIHPFKTFILLSSPYFWQAFSIWNILFIIVKLRHS